MFDLVIHGGTVLEPRGETQKTVVVDAGRIVDIVGPGIFVEARESIDASGLFVLPGMVDSHVHFRTPGLTHKESWEAATRAAAAGGVTTVIDMPNTNPPLLDPDGIGDKVALVAGRSLVDFAFHLGADPENPAPLRRFRDTEAASVKVFLAGHHTAPNVVRDHEVLREIFQIAAERDILLVFHAESDFVFNLIDRARGPIVSDLDYEASRPRSGGIVAVARVLELVEEFGSRVHILHVSSAEEVELLSAAREIGMPVTFEVLPHHLAFTDHDSIRMGTRIKLSPAIRGPEDRERLWEALFSGELSTLGSDHAPHSIAEKLGGPAQAPPGIPGVQELLVTVFTGMRRRSARSDGELLMRLVELFSSNPADIFGLSNRKGRIAIGQDADFVLFDPTVRWMLSENDVQSQCGWSAYTGWSLTGQVRRTVLRGQTVFDAESRTFGEPRGRWAHAYDSAATGMQARHG